ncbi:hypothetical protein M1L60_09775 [Actinoplanes sp. TRM 88003]|uniref:Flagellar basal body-associated protein FliL n=1 Tax=Paractinoplanes aksuensis TaxID=2939490 RepID=A0ABT1DJ71_9ACTN|nr:hypothetical protein [Actinoplanes aksuensis]MCO8270879.1 hypothetical protein [Actinoplanes aksuensis]
MSQPPYPGQPYPGEPSSGQPNQGQPPYQGQSPYQPYPGQTPQEPPAYPPTSAYPSSGQPSYGQPSGQPDYGQPQYGQQQPQYGAGQPGFGQQPGGYGTPPPPKKSKVLPIVLVSVAIVLVLCIGGVVALYMVGKNAADDVTDAVNNLPTSTSTAGPTDEPTTAPPTRAAATVTITEPTTLGGRKKLTSAQFAAIAEQLKGGLESVPGATNTVGALYGDVSDQDIVIVAAAEAPIKNPKAELEQTFYGAGIGGLKIDNITTAPTGALGGAAKCGSSETSGIDMAICTWADEGSVGMVIWYFKSVAKAKAEFPKLRAEIEKKS